GASSTGVEGPDAGVPARHGAVASYAMSASATAIRPTRAILVWRDMPPIIALERVRRPSGRHLEHLTRSRYSRGAHERRPQAIPGDPSAHRHDRRLGARAAGARALPLPRRPAPRRGARPDAA